MIMLMALTFPTLRMFIGWKFHQFLLLFTMVVTFLPIVLKGRTHKKYLFLITACFLMIVIGVRLRGTIITTLSSSLMYGFLFYLIIDKNFTFNFKSLYKFLVSLIGIETLIINLYDYTFFYFLYSDFYQSYHRLSSKMAVILCSFGFTGNLYAANSIFYGPQIASVLLAVAIILFRKDRYWLFLSIVLFSVSFSLTSCLVLLTGFILIKRSAAVSKLAVAILTLLFLVSLFYYNLLDFQYYLKGFGSSPIVWWNDTTVLEKVFGTKEGIYAWSWEFQYMRIIVYMGLLTSFISIFLNIALCIKYPSNIHVVILTMFHVSMIHVNNLAQLGVAQLVALHIACGMHGMSLNKASHKYQRCSPFMSPKEIIEASKFGVRNNV